MKETFTDEELAGMDDAEREALTDTDTGEDNGGGRKDENEPLAAGDDGKEAGQSPEDSGQAGNENEKAAENGNTAAAGVDGADPAGASGANDDVDGKAGDTDGAQAQGEPGAGDDAEAAATAEKKAADAAVEASKAAQNELDADKKALDAIKEELSGLGQKMEDGEIDFAEYHKRQLELNDQRSDLHRKHDQQQIEQKIREEENARTWTQAQDEFFSKEENAGIKDKPILYNALDMAVRANEPQARAAGKSHSWLLDKAKADVEAELGVSIGGQLSVPAPATPAKPARASVASATHVPITLGDVPAAGGNNPDGEEFGHLDRMSGMELEETLAGMSEEKVDKYLNLSQSPN